MARKDLSDNLIHFTKDLDLESAFKRLQRIINNKYLLGSNNFIKGGYNCICFSEAPLNCLANGLVNPDYYSKYSPFGIMFPKNFVFHEGGRPVIYQPDNGFALLPEELKWLHVRYEPNNDSPVDFTWEREWRLKCDYLNFNEAVANIIVLNRYWAERLIAEYEVEEDFKILQYSLILDEEIAQQYYKPFKWRIILLSE